MDINHFVLVTKAVVPDRSHGGFVNGLAFFKSVLHKKMKVQITTPKILLLKGETDMQTCTKVQFMDSILRYSEDRSTIVRKKVVDTEAQLVLIEHSMNHNTIKELAAHNITCLTQVNQHLMELTARMIAAKPIELMGHMPYKSNILGTCEEFSVVPVCGKQLVVLKSKSPAPQVATVILAGPSADELSKVKRIFRTSLTALRAALLESSFFLQGHFDPGAGFRFLQKPEIEVHRTTIKDWKCSRPQLIRVKLYSASDIPLGAFIIRVAQEAMNVCPSSSPEHLCHEHGVYFLHEQGLVQMFTNVKEVRSFDPKEDVTLMRTCFRCGSVRNGKVMLSNRSWEFSFYHFLAGFFTDVPKARCGHLFFRDSVFTFNVRTLSLEFQYVQWPVYSLCGTSFPKQKPDMTHMSDIFEEAQQGVERAVHSLHLHIDEIKEFLQSEIGFDETETLDIRSKLAIYTDRLKEIKRFAENTNLTSFGNHLEVETLRRTLRHSLSEVHDDLRVCDQHVRGLTIKQRHLTLHSSGILTHSLEPPSDLRRSMHIDSVIDDKSQTLTVSDVLRPLPSNSPKSSVRLLDQMQLPETFSGLQRGNLQLPLGHYNVCFPVEADDPLSVIAYALQTTTYVGAMEQFLAGEAVSAEEMDYEMLYGEGKAVSIRMSDETDKGNLKFKVKALFAKQFQALRLAEGLAHFDFLLSISHRANLIAVQLGKSSSTFYYSHDRRFILKGVSHREMHMFEDMAPNYFRHMAKHEFHGMPSQLIKTLGAFSVVVKDASSRSKEYYLLSANLEATMPPGSKIFDLKGTKNPRRYVKDGDTRTKMDLNFVEEFHSLPLCIRLEEKQRLDAGLWNDTIFLAKQNVIDYSLLVIINEDESVISAGIIDYMQHYTVEKAVESKYKEMVGGELPTITNPSLYKSRFREQIMFEYFIGVIN